MWCVVDVAVHIGDECISERARAAERTQGGHGPEVPNPVITRISIMGNESKMGTVTRMKVTVFCTRHIFSRKHCVVTCLLGS